MKLLKFLVVVLILLTSCKRKPDIIIKGQGYWINSTCVKSHSEEKFGPHYGYNFMNGKYEWHTGSYTESVCDSVRVDTVKVK